MAAEVGTWINHARAERGLEPVSYLGRGEAQRQAEAFRTAGRYGHDIEPDWTEASPGHAVRGSLLVRSPNSRSAVGAYVASGAGHRLVVLSEGLAGIYVGVTCSADGRAYFSVHTEYTAPRFENGQWIIPSDAPSSTPALPNTSWSGANLDDLRCTR